MSELNIEELKAAALAAMPIDTELYGDRYFDSYYSRVDLTKEQDAFITLATRDAILALIERLQVAEDAPKADRKLIGHLAPCCLNLAEKIIDGQAYCFSSASNINDGDWSHPPIPLYATIAVLRLTP